MNEDDERLIQATEMDLTQNVGGVWLCLAGAVFCAAIAVWIGVTSNLHQKENWTPLLGVCVFAAFLAYLSVTSWQIAESHRALLVQLRADASKRAAAEQPGVWPPPPSTSNK